MDELIASKDLELKNMKETLELLKMNSDRSEILLNTPLIAIQEEEQYQDLEDMKKKFV